jgi:hypothetical protein
MNLNKLLAAVFAVSVGSFSGSAIADGYVGVGIGSASYDYNDISSSTAFLVYGGYIFDDSLFGVEAAYLSLGQADITSIPGASLNITGFNASAVISSAGKSSAPLYFFGKLGIYSFDNELKPTGLSESSSGLSWGIGMGYKFNKHFSMRGEIQGFNGVKDFANNSSVPLINLGVEYHF